MTVLTEQEMIDIQSFIDQKIERARELGLQLNVNEDMWEWRALMESGPGTTGPSKTLDPKYNDVHPGNAFWVSLTTQSGDIVGCQANRFVETEDFVGEYIRTHRFFGDRCPTLHHFPVSLQDSVPVLRGRIDFGGGGWVHPDWRGNALSGYMSRVGRTLALRHFLIDYYIGFITATPNHRMYGHTRQGLSNRRHLLSGRYPGRGEPLEVDIYWMHRGEMMAQIVNELTSDYKEVAPLMTRTA